MHEQIDDTNRLTSKRMVKHMKFSRGNCIRQQPTRVQPNQTGLSVLQVCAKCQVTGHMKAVTSLLPLSNPRPGGGDMLISASLDGTVMVWDPSTTLPKGPEKEVPPKHTIKAHADGVLSIALFQAAVDTLDTQPLQLCTTGLHHTPSYSVSCIACLLQAWLHRKCLVHLHLC